MAIPMLSKRGNVSPEKMAEDTILHKLVHKYR